MSEKKVQIVALVSPETRTRLDTLRIISGNSLARELEDVIIAGLRIREAGQPQNLARVLALAQRAGMKLSEYAAAYARTFARSTFGPGLEKLEQNDNQVTGRGPVPTGPIPRVSFSDVQKR